MKLPDYTEFVSLTKLRNIMGAKLGVFIPAENPHRLTAEELDKLATIGIDIPLNEVKVLSDGTLGYKNSRVILYIRDVTQYKDTALEEVRLPRFHVSDCKTLQDMRDNNRFERYVVSTREDGVFNLNIINKRESTTVKISERLNICQNCLSKLSWNGFATSLTKSEKKQIQVK